MAKPEQTYNTEMHHPPPDVAAINANMVLYTWVSFFLVLMVLYKIAWKPIFTLLDQREEKIAKSLEDAEKIERAMATLEADRQKRIVEAQRQAQDILDESRRAANEAAKQAKAKAATEAQIMLNNANREVQVLVDKARLQLKEESVQLSMRLASKILEEDLDPKRQRKIVDRFLDQM